MWVKLHVFHPTTTLGSFKPRDVFVYHIALFYLH